MNIFDKIRELELADDSYVVVAGGVLVALGLLEWDDDIDIAVSPAVFESLKLQGWQQESWHGKTVLKHGVYDVGIDFGDWSLDDLRSDALYIQGIPFINPEKLLAWKCQMNRPKDARHIALLKTYVRQS